MKILVINTGSSSIKYELFDMDEHRAVASGTAERIGEESGRLVHTGFSENGEPVKTEKEAAIHDHQAGLTLVVDMLMDPKNGAIRDKSEIAAVGHRVVHGGEAFQATTVIDEKVIEAIRENIPLAPLHNPANLTGIEVAMDIFPDAPQVAVFDTAFHQTIPEQAYLYAIPYGLYEKERVRRYGFHGTSHAYVAEKAAEHMGCALEDLDLITIHLGNGASMAAIKKGRSMDTTMGMTPLAGLVMGTRCGDVDPALPFFLADHLGMSLKEIDALLNKESGLRGICGSNDMREVIAKKEAGDRMAEIAVEIYAYRIKKYIGAYFAALGNLDAIVFTAGIGENAPIVRALCCLGLEKMGILLDEEKNSQEGDSIQEISARESNVKILVIPTNEELRIAQETEGVIRGQKGT